MPNLRRVATAPLTSLLIAVAVFALASTVYSLTPTTRLADRPGFDDAMTALAAYDATTFVVVTPPEQTEALDEIPKHLPASDGAPATEAMMSRWSSIVAVGPRGSGLPGFTNELERRIFGDVDLVRYGNPSGERVIFDLARDLDRVAITLRGATDIVCNVPGPDGYRCPGRPGWNHVGPARLRVNGAVWPSTWAHPANDYGLELALGEVELSDAIVLEAALDDNVARNGAAVELELRVGDSVRKVTRSPAPGIVTTRVPTKAGSREPVTLTIRTAADGARHLGVRLRITARQQ